MKKSLWLFHKPVMRDEKKSVRVSASFILCTKSSLLIFLLRKLKLLKSMASKENRKAPVFKRVAYFT